MWTKNKKGFTLAELLIVVAIIGVLVAISIPIFSSQLEKSRFAVDQSNVRNAKATAAAEYLSTGASGEVEYYYDASSGKVTSDFAAAKQIPGYGKSTMKEEGVEGTGKSNGMAGIVMVTIDTAGIGEVRWTKNDIEYVRDDAKSYLSEDGKSLIFKPTGLKILSFKDSQTPLQQLSEEEKSKVITISFEANNEYPDDLSRNGQGRGMNFENQFNGYSNVTRLDLSGISLSRIKLEDWKALPSLNTIVLPTATIKDPFNIPGNWYCVDGGEKVYLPKNKDGSRVNKNTSGLEGKTIHKD
ncbi:type IV pilin protein [Clostridium vitabionis]|uniref:type IV pilin protein n=1 Tax=Clostridium vitabionis TaxID=2784388 RepID=UPI00188B246D|nr:prepilin-type N-terminal cleavage/methylation domain-containing protein [Clostridium vitabionis]